MRFGRASVVSALVIAALGIGSGVTYANPLPSDSDAVTTYQTTVGPEGRTVSTTLQNGTFRIDPSASAVDVLDPAGQTILTLPLAYSVRGMVFPIAAALDSAATTLTLTPDTTNVAAALPLHDVATTNEAYQNLVRQLEIGWLNGGGMSTGIGAGIGAVVGCIFFFFVGCIPGALIGGAIGAVTGISNANPNFQPAIFDLLASF